MSKCEIAQIDHIVMTVADMSKTIDFTVRFGNSSEFVPPRGRAKVTAFWHAKINLHDAASPYVPHAKAPQAGSVDLCLSAPNRLMNGRLIWPIMVCLLVDRA